MLLIARLLSKDIPRKVSRASLCRPSCRFSWTRIRRRYTVMRFRPLADSTQTGSRPRWCHRNRGGKRRHDMGGNSMESKNDSSREKDQTKEPALTNDAQYGKIGRASCRERV